MPEAALAAGPLSLVVRAGAGYNTIADGAFTGAVGVPMVIQNSGNNVLIQNATIINVQFQP